MKTPKAPIELKIPPEVRRVLISVGLPNAEDGDSRRRVRVSDVESTLPPGREFYAKVTEGLHVHDEDRLVFELIGQLGAAGFRDIKRAAPPETAGYWICFANEQA